MSKRVFLQIAYDGARYSGWQVQPDKTSVMGVLQDCLSKMHQREVRVHGCGRTDAGVHAQQFFLHLDDPGDIRDDLAFRLNAFVPTDIRVLQLHRGVPPDAHARKDALLRTYRYYVHSAPNPFLDPWSLFYPWKGLDTESMEEVAAAIKETRNFRGLTRKLKNEDSVYCQIWNSSLTFLDGGKHFFYEISADRFLTGMVRRIMGLLLLVGSGRMKTSEVITALEQAEKHEKNLSAPPQGLHLWQVRYPYLDLEPALLRNGHPGFMEFR